MYMYLHIDKAGRIVLPKAVRQQLKLMPGSKLEVVPSTDGVFLRPVALLPEVQQTCGFLVNSVISAAASEAELTPIADTSSDEPEDTSGSV